eukprot:4823414-Prymnesium_polylepis.1
MDPGIIETPAGRAPENTPAEETQSDMDPHQFAQSQADDAQKSENTRESSGTAAQGQDPGAAT